MANKLLSIVKWVLLLVLIVTLGYGIYGQIYLANERTEDMSFCQPLDTKWYRVRADGKREEIILPSNVRIEDAKVDVIETVLYDEIATGACVSIISSKQDVNVYIDGELRETYSTKDTRLFGKTSVGRYIFVELDDADAGKTLRIEMSSDSKYLGTVKQVYYGDKLGIWLSYVKANIASIVIPFISLFIALAAILVSFAYYLRTKKTVSVFYYAVSVALISLWILTVSSMRQLIFNNITVIHDVSIVLTTIYIVPLCLYFNRLQNGRYKLIQSIYALFALLYCIVVNVLVIFNIVDTSNTAEANFVVIGLTIAMFVYTLYLDYVSKKMQEYKDVAIGFVILCMTGVVQMSVYFIPPMPYEGNALSVSHSVKEIKKVSDEKDFLEEKVSVNQLKIEKLTYQALETLANTIDAKDKYTNGHSNRVAHYSMEIAKRMGKDEDEAIAIYFMGLLHDIGKIGVSEQILNKQGPLTEMEYDAMKGHVEYSVGIIRHLPSMDYVIPAVIGHHERYDGKGYPRRIAGKDIPLAARILCIADSFDAMISKRCYKPEMSVDYALHELQRGAGTQFDPELTQKFVRLVMDKKITPVITKISKEEIGSSVAS